MASCRLVNFILGNDLLPDRHQAIVQTIADLFRIGP